MSVASLKQAQPRCMYDILFIKRTYSLGSVYPSAFLLVRKMATGWKLTAALTLVPKNRAFPVVYADDRTKFTAPTQK